MAGGGTDFETLLPDEPEPPTEGYKLETCSAGARAPVEIALTCGLPHAVIGTLVLIHGTVAHKVSLTLSHQYIV